MNKKDNKQAKNKISITEEYFGYHEKYQEKYGKKTVVLLEVGSFFELYQNPINNKGPDLYKICGEILNLVVTRKDKTIPLSDSNVLMSGTPSHCVSKYIKLLIDNHYTVVIYDQHKTASGITRSLQGVYSPSTYIDNIDASNKYLMLLYIEINNAINSSKPNISIGMCAIDISIGEVYYYEFHGSGLINENESIEEAQRFYHHYRPIELIVYQINNSTEKFNKLIDKIDLLPNQVLLDYEKINPSYGKISYQNALLKKVYTECGMITPIEFFDLNKFPYAVIALISAFDYIYQHNENLIYQLKHPKYFNEHKYMILGNNAQYQLNIVDYYNWEQIDTKFQSLNVVVNNCITPMAKRNLKQRLCAPYTNIDTINNYYNLTDKILENSIYENCRDHLKGINDLDKLFRKLSIKFIQPYELYSIYESFSHTIELIQMLLNTNLKLDILNIFSKKQIKIFNEAIEYLGKTFNINKLKINNLIEIKESFYNKNIHNDIDDIENKIIKSIGFIDKLANVLEKYDNNINLTIKHNDRDGYYLSTTKIRGKKLEEALKLEKSELKINNISINVSDLIFTYQTSIAKISYPGLSDHSDELDELYNELTNVVKKNFYIDTIEWYHRYSKTFRDIINLIIEVDLISNNAWTSVKYHYSRPIVSFESEGNSFINANNLRHPIIERIIDYEYVPHNVLLDDNISGNMIYGTNSAGKTSIMKAVGLCLIMAQCGLYVPADIFEYKIFDSLYTRISGNDNLFKGQSSFIIEMNELRSILKKANNKTLIIGDEICRGTEYLSANAIVASTILRLVDLKAKFMFATHLHDLIKINKIKELNQIKFFYLSVEKIGNDLVFTRKMMEGTGEQIYGITIAKYILDDPIFINTAVELKNEMLENNNITTTLISDKKSNYNNEIYMDSCSICNSKDNLESHHINFQKNFENSKIGLIFKDKKHIVKDSKANLITLCNKCHDDLHGQKIKINTKINTTNGIQVI
jgi:DNA mismatch repair protein MutS